MLTQPKSVALKFIVVSVKYTRTMNYYMPPLKRLKHVSNLSQLFTLKNWLPVILFQAPAVRREKQKMFCLMAKGATIYGAVVR